MNNAEWATVAQTTCHFAHPLAHLFEGMGNYGPDVADSTPILTSPNRLGSTPKTG